MDIITAQTRVKVHTRRSCLPDVARLVAIDHITMPSDLWIEERDARCFISTALPQTILYTIELEGIRQRVIGSFVIEITDHYYSLPYISIHPEYQNRGIGTALIEHFCRERLHPIRRNRICIVVRERFTRFQNFLKHRSFRAIHIARDYFHENRRKDKRSHHEDGIFFRYILDEFNDFVEEPKPVPISIHRRFKPCHRFSAFFEE